MKPLKFVSAFFLSMLVFILNSCSPMINSTTSTAPGQDSPILIRAQIWVQKKVPYGSFGFHNNPPFHDGYKTDCSGFVSYAWGLKAPGIGTNQFVNENYATVISISDLQPGDVLNNDQADTAGHMVIFVRWLDRTKNIFDAYDLNTDPGYTSEKTYTLVQIPNSNDWTISEIDPWAHGPYRAERLNTSGFGATPDSNNSKSSYFNGQWKLYYNPSGSQSPDMEFLKNNIVIVTGYDNSQMATQYQILSNNRIQISSQIFQYSISDENTFTIRDSNSIEGDISQTFRRMAGSQIDTINQVEQGCYLKLSPLNLICNNYQVSLNLLNESMSSILNEFNSQGKVASEIGIAHTAANYVLIYYTFENNPQNPSFAIVFNSADQLIVPVGNLTDLNQEGITITSYELIWKK